jgi:hypothetical protein
VKADQKARGRFLGGTRPFGYQRGEGDELIPDEDEQKAIREMRRLREQGMARRPIAEAMRAKDKINHEGVACLFPAFPAKFAGRFYRPLQSEARRAPACRA